MKKNAFIAYTPFHVLLAICVAFDHPECENHLLIVENFGEFEKLYLSLQEWNEKPFASISKFPGEYSLRQESYFEKRWNKYYKVRKSCKEILHFMKKNNISSLYLGNEERPQSLCVLNYIEKIGVGEIAVFYIEDGAVTYNSSLEKKDLHYILIGKIFFGLWWRNIPVMGVSSIFKGIHVLYPEIVRPELQNKLKFKLNLNNILKLKENNLLNDYLDKYNISNEEISKIEAVILLPHSSVLGANRDYKVMISEIITFLVDSNRHIAIKYHPRDGNEDYLKLKSIINIRVLPSSIPVEFIFLAENKINWVVSDSSTTLLTAACILKKCKSISLGELTERKDVRFNNSLKSVGVSLPKSLDELKFLLS
jgi:hypothetical protein